jgi:hypothetical protein
MIIITIMFAMVPSFYLTPAVCATAAAIDSQM